MLSYLDLTTTDPTFNLAAEEFVFEKLPQDRMYLMLWQNDNAIIIGKNQNTLAEINEAFVAAHGIKVVRRLSGGGAVYHDMGNLNYTVIADADTEGLDFHRFCQLVVRALEKLGVDAQINGRNDMTIGGKKFSGNAQYTKNGRVMHHGTILFDTNPEVLAGALRVDEEKIRAKGVKSVRSRVTNVRPCLPEDMTLPAFRKVLLESILEDIPGEFYEFTPEDLAQIELLRRRYATWEWNFGHSPAGTLCKQRRIEGCGSVAAYLDLQHGRIRQVSFRGDFFSTRDPAELGALLVGCRPERTDLETALTDVDASRYFMGLDTRTLLSLLCE